MNILLKSAKYIEYILLLLGVVIFALVMVFDSSTAKGEEGSFVGTILLWAEILLAIAVVIAVILPAINLIQNPSGAGKSLYGIIGVIAVVAISYLCSSADPITLANGSVIDDNFTLIFSDMAIITTYICASIAILAIICTEIYRLTR